MLSVSNPWHNVSPGENVPEKVNGIIEIPKGSKGKYELDKKSGLLKLDRVLYSSVHYRQIMVSFLKLIAMTKIL